MPIDVHLKRRGPTSDEVVAEQKRQAEALKEQKQQHNAIARAEAHAPAPTTIDTRTPEEIYSDTIAPSSFFDLPKTLSFLLATATRKSAQTPILSHCSTKH